MNNLKIFLGNKADYFRQQGIMDPLEGLLSR